MVTEIQHIREVKTLLPRRIVDGDTWWCYLDLGYRQLGLFEFRLHGWDTPEKQGVDASPWERERAREATNVAAIWWLDEIRAGNRRILIQSEVDPEKYGRWLGILWSETPTGHRTFLGEHLRDLQLAVESDGTAGTRWRDTYVG